MRYELSRVKSGMGKMSSEFQKSDIVKKEGRKEGRKEMFYLTTQHILFMVVWHYTSCGALDGKERKCFI